MNNLPPCLAQLLADKRIPQSQLPHASRQLLKPLLHGNILEINRVGRGEIISIRDEPAFTTWLEQQFPSYNRTWDMPEDSTRALAIAQRRNSKTAGAGVACSVLHLRAFQSEKTTIDDKELPAAQLTTQYGLAACAIGRHTKISFQGKIALVENLELFLQAETILPNISVILNSAGRISDKLIHCLARSDSDTPPLLHLPDYDPVGLSDYLRLRAALHDRVKLFLPENLKEYFTRFGNKKLLTEKPRNRALLETLGNTKWPCPESAQVYDLIKTTGSGLEQEALLITVRKS